MAEVCPDCGASFSSAAELTHHVKSAHHGGDPRASLGMNPATSSPGYVCGLCGHAFPTAEALAEHNLTREERRRRERNVPGVAEGA